ncbi:MAG: TonB-dependent receptor [Neisseria sp.]|nr:TonB-dependent receptor [Neisseria sp.]
MTPNLKQKIIPLVFFACYQQVYAADADVQAADEVGQLESVTVTGKRRNDKTEQSKSYTIDSMSTATGLRISGKDTPQSVSVITRQQLDDKAVHTLEDAMKNSTGVNVVRDSGLQTRFLSRGFYVDQIGEDGITSNVAGRSGYTAKIDVSPSTDLAVYDHIEVVRGATGLTQSNSEPGGTINLIRKRPTSAFRHTGEITVDQRGSKRLMLDVSGSLSREHGVRGRLVGVHDDHKSFKDKVWGKKNMLYGILEADIGGNGVFTMGGMHQKSTEIPDFAGIMLPCENPKAYSTFENNCNNPVSLPRNTYFGMDWSRLRADKTNLFTGFKYTFDNGWRLNAEASYTKNRSDAKVGQFFIRNEHTAGIAGSPATGAILPNGTVIPYDTPDNEVRQILAEEERKDRETYQQAKTQYRATEFDRNAYEAARAKALDANPWAWYDEDTYIAEELSNRGIVDYSYAYSMFNYNQAKGKRNTDHIAFNASTMRHNKKDVQYGFKLDFSGQYALFGRSHDFYTGYTYNNEDIESDYLEIFDRNYRVKTSNPGAGMCESVPFEISPTAMKGNELAEPDWDKYDDKGNVWIRRRGCENATTAAAGQSDPSKAKAAYNYSRYVNKNETHALTVSTRFNATDRLHLLGGMHFTRYKASQSKNMSVLNGDPASSFQNQSSLDADDDHYTARMKGHKFTPYAGITYDLTPQQNLYTSYTKIFKQQDEVDVSSKQLLPPLIGTNYEIGWKGSFFEGRLNSSLAIFVLDQKNRTIVDFGYVRNENGQGQWQTIARPAGRVRSKGFEFELAGEITDDWKIFAGYTYNKSRYKNADEVNALQIANTKHADDAFNFSNHTPVQMFRLGTSYRIPRTGLTIGGGVSAQSKTKSLYNVKQGGYGLVDGFVQYEMGPHVKLNLIGTNLTDRTYFENNANRTRGMNNFYGQPRTLSLKLDWRF